MLKLDLHLDGTETDKSCLNVPTSLSEINYDYLREVTSNVNIEQFYALVACCVFGSFEQRFSSDKKKDTMGAAFILVKANDPSGKFITKDGDKLICSPQEVMLGNEVVVPANILSSSSVLKEVSKAKDNKTIAAVKINLNTISNSTPYHDFKNPINHVPFYTISFKLIPISAIHGSYTNDKLVSVKSMYYHE